MTSFPGWSWEYIDDSMTLPRLSAINSYQKAHPPLHIMVAAYLGVNKDKASDGTAAPAAGLNENGESLFDLFPQGGAK